MTDNPERMRIDSSGNLLVGTTSRLSSELLTVKGPIIAQRTNATQGLQMSAESGDMTFTAFNDSNDSRLQFIWQQRTNTPATFEVMRIDSSGNFLVGTTAQVQSGKQTISFNGSTHNGLIVQDTNDTSSGRFVGFNLNTGSSIGSIERVGATSAVIYNTTSDQRLKSNIEDASPVLDKLMEVKVRQFDWTEGNLHQDAGFIAQELASVLSGIVTKGKTAEDMWQMDYSRLTPYLVKAIQEQQALIENLTTRLNALEGK
jgi:hypothetical protein